MSLIAGSRLPHEISNVFDRDVHVMNSPIAFVVLVQIRSGDIEPQGLGFHLISQGIERTLVKDSGGIEQLIHKFNSLAYDHFIDEASVN